MMVSSLHSVSKKDTYIAIISTTVETETPEKELDIAFELIGPYKEKFIKISDTYVSTGPKGDGLFVSDSFDATSHFESETENVLKMYTQITGEELNLKDLPEEPADY